MAKPIVVLADRLRNWVRIEIASTGRNIRYGGILRDAPYFFAHFLHSKKQNGRFLGVSQNKMHGMSILKPRMVLLRIANCKLQSSKT